jgi:hypothetical protein
MQERPDVANLHIVTYARILFDICSFSTAVAKNLAIPFLGDLFLGRTERTSSQYSLFNCPKNYIIPAANYPQAIILGRSSEYGLPLWSSGRVPGYR